MSSLVVIRSRYGSDDLKTKAVCLQDDTAHKKVHKKAQLQTRMPIKDHLKPIAISQSPSHLQDTSSGGDFLTLYTRKSHTEDYCNTAV